MAEKLLEDYPHGKLQIIKGGHSSKINMDDFNKLINPYLA